VSGRGNRGTQRLGVIVVVVIGAASTLAGCSQFSSTGLQFRQDPSIEFVGPPERSAVAVPFELAWIDTDRPPGTRYAVVVNQAPMPPGEGLDWFTRDDDVCERTPGCPTVDDLRLRGVIVTDEPRAEVAIVPMVIGGRVTGQDEFTVIRIDGDGVRISETAFVRSLDVEPRPGL
jgi:hypothetical protein